ncbi:tyrosine-type recombinase/integrase [Paenibacillus zanthoxyli]
MGEFLEIWLNDNAKQKYKTTFYDVEESMIRTRIKPTLGRFKL